MRSNSSSNRRPGVRLAMSRPLALCLGVALAAAPAPALADVRLGGDSGGYFTVAVKSWWEIPFRSVIRQRFDFSCGSASVATLLTHHYARPTLEREPFAQMWKLGDRETISKVGFSMFDMKTYLQSIGYRAEGFRITMDQLRQIRRPTIVLLDLNGYKHFVVVKGIRADRVLVGDSTLGLNEYSAEDFEKYWNNIALAIVSTPAKTRPVFNLASDWGPWSRAPTDQAGNQLDQSAGDLTTFLPPTYQLTPQLLLDIRVPF